jgi:hypothetical protein
VAYRLGCLVYQRHATVWASLSSPPQISPPVPG